MVNIKTYTHTKEGKEVLDILEHVTSTYGMEVYKCYNCEELYGSSPRLALYNDKPTCGLCQDILKIEQRDAFGFERTED